MQMRRSTWIFAGIALGALALASFVGPRSYFLHGGGTTGGSGPLPLPIPLGGGLTAGGGAASAGKVHLDARLDASSVLLGGGGEAWMAVSLGADPVEAAARAPLNLAIVIDASGSMLGAPLDGAKAAAKEMIARLAASDRVALVAYGSAGSVLVPSTPLDGEARERLTHAIEGLGDMGGTNISDGLELARAEVARGASSERVNRVVLLSDGEANAGIQTAEGLGGIARSMAAGGVSVTAMGLGLDYDAKTMMAIAEHGGGNYYFIESVEQLAGIFKNEFGALASVVAKGTEVEIVPAPGVEIAEVVGYASDRRGTAVVIHPGDLYGGQERKIVLRLRVPAAVEGPLTVANVALHFADALAGGAPATAAATVGALVVADASLVEKSRDGAVSAKVETVKIARKMDEATRAYEKGDKAEASRLIGEGKDTYARAAAAGLAMPASAAPAMEELDDLVHRGDADSGKKFEKKASADSMMMTH
ncbi:MAG TPA: VWA domain-containing protein [Myxococcota bacterium]|jgi:Ca-activated chloride channel family protein|nr:VWA domain-containing protein [Myxococcota bacterium]